MSFRTSSTRGRVALVAAFAAPALLAAACGSDSDQSGAASNEPATVEVAIDTFMFQPDALQIHEGDTVTWTNHDAITHTVTSGTREYDPANGGLVTATHKSGLFDQELDGKGATATFTYSKTGTYHYFCDRHPGMEADVEVS
jgi:plastocyanin